MKRKQVFITKAYKWKLKDLTSNPRLLQELFIEWMIWSRNRQICQIVLFEENHNVSSENPEWVPIALWQESLRWSTVIHIGDVVLEVNHRKTELEVPEPDVF